MGSAFFGLGIAGLRRDDMKESEAALRTLPAT